MNNQLQPLSGSGHSSEGLNEAPTFPQRLTAALQWLHDTAGLKSRPFGSRPSETRLFGSRPFETRPFGSRLFKWRLFKTGVDLRVASVSLLAASVVLCAAGCRRAQTTTPVAISGMALSENPVGPVPGVVHVMHYSQDPYLTDPVALQDGRRLFNWYNCSGCHGGHAGGGMGPSLRDPVWLYGDRDDQIFDSIAEGRSKGMPAWGSKIPEEQIWELVAYIKSMGTPLEPDPPVEPSDENVGNPEHNTPLGIGTQTRVAGRP